MRPKHWLIIGSMLGASGVLLGAYHAHGLEKMLAKQSLEAEVIAKRMDNCEVAVRYQMYHALALLAVGLLAERAGGRCLTVAGVLFLLGVIGFSGGLYLIVFTGNSIHWSIVPAGGLLLVGGWCALACGCCCGRNVEPAS